MLGNQHAYTIIYLMMCASVDIVRTLKQEDPDH